MRPETKELKKVYTFRTEHLGDRALAGQLAASNRRMKAMKSDHPDYPKVLAYNTALKAESAKRPKTPTAPTEEKKNAAEQSGNLE